MKTTLDIQHTGTLGDADRHRMGFDEHSVTQLMGVLTDLYSNKAAAVIREYTTNAIDSHVAAGNTAPVQIERPSALNPTFVVRDFGVGMTVEQIIKEYAKYGFSSKRDSNEQTGMLGLGCKSGLTYTSQFTVTARKDGREAVVLVTRDADGCGVVQIVNEGPTTEPNGVEVSIPVRYTNEFNTEINSFVRFLDPGLVLVDDAPYPTVWEDKLYRHLDDDVLISSTGENRIVMGGVAYPIPNTHLPIPRDDGYNAPKAGVIARVPIGTVNFTPSREALHLTKRTKETLDTLRDYVRSTTMRVAVADVAAAPNATEALVRATSWKPMMAALDRRYNPRMVYKGSMGTPFTWGDQEVPLTDEYTVPDDENVFTWTSFSSINSETQNNVRRIPINPSNTNTGHTPILVTGFSMGAISKQMKQKMKIWLETNVPANVYGRWNDFKFYLYSGADLPLPWWDGVQTVAFDVINKIDLPKPPRKPKPEEPVWNVIHKTAHHYMLRSLTPKEAAGRVIISTTDQPYGLQEEYNVLFHLIPGTYVRVPKPSMGSFKKQYPHAEYVMDAIKAESERFLASVTDAEWFIFQHNEDVTGSGVFQLKASQVRDPELKRVLNGFSGARQDIHYLMSQWNRLLRVSFMETIKVKAAGKKVSDLGLNKVEARYPLCIHSSLTHTRRHRDIRDEDFRRMLTEYVNSVYLARQHRNAATKVKLAAAGLAGRRRRLRRINAKKRRDVQRIVLGRRTLIRERRLYLAFRREQDAKLRAHAARRKAAREEVIRKRHLQDIARLMAAQALNAQKSPQSTAVPV